VQSQRAPATSWKQIKAKSRHKLTPEQEAEDRVWVERELLAMSLREMREMVGKNQVDVAAAVETTQSELSRLERRDDFFLSTLKKYVKALGGELEIIARFGDKSVRLRGV
jgi:predicted transcriptional regulator